MYSLLTALDTPQTANLANYKFEPVMTVLAACIRIHSICIITRTSDQEMTASLPRHGKIKRCENV